jgi:FAD/FMN-containing dehydrogenase
MNKIAHYLQEHVSGEVITSSDVRRHFSTDASIFQITPTVVVYPRNEGDVRKILRFTWQLAERGRIFPITARGSGTDQTGAAIGSGIILAFPAHMNRILELDSKSGIVVVEPGINYGKLQQALLTHDRFLPPYPSSIEYTTIGGAVGNNSGGDKSIKYGTTVDFVKSLKVVLSNGEVIKTKRLNKRDLNKKLGLTNFEGEVYRQIDSLIEDNQQLVDGLNLSVTKNVSGYALNQVKRKDGSFDLTPLIVGSQGTLGIVSEITLTTELRRPTSTLMAIAIDDLKVMEEIILEIRKFPELPSIMELVDDNLLKLVQEHDPNLITDVVKEPIPKFILLVEFDNPSEHVQKRLSKRLVKLLKHYQVPYQMETDPERKDNLWKIRHSTVAVLAHVDTAGKPVPIIEDGIVPPEQLAKLITGIHGLFSKHKIPIAIYGHAGDAHLHLRPLIDLKSIGDRQKVFRLMNDYHSLIISLGGSITGENGDGRLRGPYLSSQYGTDTYEMFVKVKKIFDPYNTLNPGVKIDAKIENILPIMREEYVLGHLYDHLPHI